ncbi:hypothetical protein CL656_06070 [bacterium]|nr:hypothetical protein [bacterium]
MLNFLKDNRSKLNLFKKIYRFTKFKYFIKNSNKTLIYIHVGKCGGVTLQKALLKSEWIKKFNSFHTIHIEKPPILDNANYVLIIRNPIQRVISAFNWRYKLVVEDEVQKKRFKGEWDILNKYKNINNLAEQLYRGDQIDRTVEGDFRKIHHLKENIAYYLKDLLLDLNKSQVLEVFATEFLDEDIFRVLKIRNDLNIHRNSNKVSKNKKSLSQKGYSNLKRFLSEDYKCLAKILEFNNTSKTRYETLMK